MKVYLIGAGPGDPGLLTLRGKQLLGQADVVIHDHLAAADLLHFARPDAEKIYVGKQAGLHALSQDGINRLLVRKAREGKTVVRLKGGDPYIFGRGGEEAEILHAAGIEFEEVPGISSTIAGPAYAGIPLTHRALASSVTIITGHEEAGRTTSVHNWKALAASASTLVFVMGMKNLPHICAKLVEAGLSPDTPAAVIHWATTPRQKTLTAALGDLAEKARLAGLKNPSIIVVGEVVRLHDSLAWFERRPLFGLGVVVTRAREQASAISGGLRELGAHVVEFPVIAIRPLADTGRIDAAVADIGRYDWLVLTSANGVDIFFDRLQACGKDCRALSGLGVAAIGPATAAALQRHGIVADVVPDEYRAEAVAAAMVAAGVAGKRILLPRARIARDALPAALIAAGAEVDIIPIYETVAVAQDAEALLQEIADGAIRCITFGSSSTVRNFFACVDPQRLRQAGGLRFACIGPVTAATLGEYGFACDIRPDRYTIPALIAAVKDHFTATAGTRPVEAR